MTTTVKDELQRLLQKAIKAEHASKGTLQRYRKDKNDLIVIASEGFSDQFLEHFKIVKPFDTSSCGRAFGMGIPIWIDDVEQDLAFRPNLEIAKIESFRAVKSIPIFTGKGEKVGVISTHYKESRWRWEFDNLKEILSEFAALMEADVNLFS